ncbi:MAG: hypothetical protein KME54_29390 [Tolypothrix brevis GSE-NOS-MK-07-07A]|jgi:hypothetical protein|nr:hypothetical protein [Tolypothrix brevis GSE-NOS-MK-07-07A]
MSNKTHAANSDALVSELAASLLRTIDGHLYLLGWSRQHPRIKEFINALNKKHTYLNLLGLEGVPPRYLKRLSEFLKIYSQCDQLIKKFNLDWEDPIINGGHKKMYLLGWQHLYECLENKYFLMNMPKAETKQRKKKTASSG